MRFLLVFIGLTRLPGFIAKRMAKSFSAILMVGTALTTFQATSQVTSDCWYGVDCPVQVSFDGSVCTPENCWCGPTRFLPQGAQGRVKINANLLRLRLPSWIEWDRFGTFGSLIVLSNFGPKREGTIEFIYETNQGNIRSCTFRIVQLGANDDGDDTPEYATVINNGQKLRASIEPVGDVDWYRFRIEARSWVHVELNGDEGDTEVWLYGHDSFTKLVAYDDDSGSRFFPE